MALETDARATIEIFKNNSVRQLMREPRYLHDEVTGNPTKPKM